MPFTCLPCPANKHLSIRGAGDSPALWPVLLLLSAIPCSAAYHVSTNVHYCNGGGRPLLMDIFFPSAPVRRPTPAVLWLHGGNWSSGDKSWNDGARFVAESGFITASISYRLSGEARFPAAVNDAKCAIRFLRANAARYGIDADEIGVFGQSAGGQLALLVALASGMEGDGGWPGVSSRVRAVAAWYPPTDFRHVEKEYSLRARASIFHFLGFLPEKNAEVYRAASPISYVSPTAPPLLLVHGEDDRTVPISQSVRLFEAYQRAGLPVEFLRVANAHHDFLPADPHRPLVPPVNEIHTRTVSFFQIHLAEH